MIEGVFVKQIKKNTDERGFFAEVLKDTDHFFKNIKQTSYSETLPGVVKAFHYHKNQDDYFFAPAGDCLIVLYDLRKKSKTYKETQAIRSGENNLCLVFIPKGVAHGYKALGDKPLGMFYHTTKSYDPTDEYRINPNDEKIGFDWETAR